MIRLRFPPLWRLRLQAVAMLLLACPSLASPSLAAPPGDCDLVRIGERMSWAQDLRDYVDLWMELGITEEAASDLEQLPAALAEVTRLLDACPPSRPVRQLRTDVVAMQDWSRRALRLIGD